MNRRFTIILVLVAAFSVVLASAAFAGESTGKDRFRADLNALNDSGASGVAKIVRDGNELRVKMDGHGFAPGLPHAQHIHGFKKAVSECPTLAADQNDDGLVNTVEGVPFYGPIRVSLTTEGDTSPSSGLAVTRFPVADTDGALAYERSFKVPAKVAANPGRFAIVQHGVDLNGNGVYDFEGAGASELDPSLPQEATIPATCGVIDRVVPAMER